MSERLDAARRLEPSGMEVRGGRVEGTLREVKVAIEDAGPERTLKLDVGMDVRWERIGRSEALDDPNVVQTGDADFDRAITVVARGGEEPAVRGVFALDQTRAAVRAFFERYPFARIDGRTVTVPRVVAQKPETSACLEQGTALILALRAAIARAPVPALKEPPQLGRPEALGQVLYVGGMLTFLVLLGIFGFTGWSLAFAGAALSIGLLSWGAVRR